MLLNLAFCYPKNVCPNLLLICGNSAINQLVIILLILEFLGEKPRNSFLFIRRRGAVCF